MEKTMMHDQFNYAFVHGDALGSWVWDETIAALDRQTDGAFGRALALDAPGCGLKRSSATDELTLEDVATEFIEDIQRAGMENVVLVGHSLGGQAMALMAELQPELFRRLVYVSCLIPRPGQNVAQMMGTGLHGSNPGEVGYPLDPTSSDPYHLLAAMLCNDMDQEQAPAFLSKLGADTWPPQTYTFTEWRYDHLDRMPATYVVCLRDQSLPAGWQEVFAARFKVDEIVRVDAGHQVMNTRPEALAEILRHEAQRTPAVDIRSRRSTAANRKAGGRHPGKKQSNV
jgi:pimeloyl-ACP methyl ester carboxylesterase